MKVKYRAPNKDKVLRTEVQLSAQLLQEKDQSTFVTDRDLIALLDACGLESTPVWLDVSRSTGLPEKHWDEPLHLIGKHYGTR